MSEYQYYEFVAVDRPLDRGQMAELRALSSRAQITPTRFVNTYNWGDLHGDPAKLVEQYFDAFLYVANWGTHRFMLRLPRRLLDLATAERYCSGEAASFRATGDHLILDLISEDEGGDWEAEGEGWLASIIPVRADLAAGDLRALYVAWLLLVTCGEIEDDDVEPPVPPDLRRLTASLQSLAEFLRVNQDLLAAAAEASPDSSVSGDTPSGALAVWIAGLPTADKDNLLLRAAEGDGALLGVELLARFRRDSAPPGSAAAPRRRVAALLKAAEACRAERERRLAEERAGERARREREEALAREQRLKLLQPRQAAVWRDIETKIASKRQAEYGEALRLLADLKALAERDGRQDDFDRRVRQIRQAHARKYSFVERLDRAGLGGPAS